MEHPIYAALLPFAEPHRVKDFSRYFQTYEGGYGEGDLFIGVMVPSRREVAKEWALLWDETILASGLHHPCHEVRHTALFAIMRRFGAERKRRQYWHDFLKMNSAGLDNWDLVDSCAYNIFGRWAYETGNYKTLESFLASSSVWERRIAVVSTLHMINAGRYDEAIAYCRIASQDAPDILQKGIGWVLKSLWQKDRALAENELQDGYLNGQYTRLIVRIGLEKASKDFRNDFLAMR